MPFNTNIITISMAHGTSSSMPKSEGLSNNSWTESIFQISWLRDLKKLERKKIFGPNGLVQGLSKCISWLYFLVTRCCSPLEVRTSLLIAPSRRYLLSRQIPFSLTWEDSVITLKTGQEMLTCKLGYVSSYSTVQSIITVMTSIRNFVPLYVNCTTYFSKNALLIISSTCWWLFSPIPKPWGL